MSTINRTIEKVKSFGDLPDGWHYGEGEAVSPHQIKRAERFLLLAEIWGFEEANAFPGVDGQIELTFYPDDRTFALMFETDGTVSITEEIAGEIISDVYEQTAQVAEQRLWELSQRNQIIYDLSISGIGIREKTGSGLRRSSVPRKNKTRFAVSRSSRPPAYWKPRKQSVSTSRTITVPWRVTPSSFCV